MSEQSWSRCPLTLTFVLHNHSFPLGATKLCVVLTLLDPARLKLVLPDVGVCPWCVTVTKPLMPLFPRTCNGATQDWGILGRSPIQPPISTGQRLRRGGWYYSLSHSSNGGRWFSHPKNIWVEYFLIKGPSVLQGRHMSLLWADTGQLCLFLQLCLSFICGTNVSLSISLSWASGIQV